MTEFFRSLSRKNKVALDLCQFRKRWMNVSPSSDGAHKLKIEFATILGELQKLEDSHEHIEFVPKLNNLSPGI